MYPDIRGRGQTRSIANIKREDYSRSVSACPSRLSRSSSFSSYAASDFSAASVASTATSYCDHDDSPLDGFSEASLTDVGSSTFSHLEIASPEYWHIRGEGHVPSGGASLPACSAPAPISKPFARLLQSHYSAQHPSASEERPRLTPIGHERAYLQRQRGSRARFNPPTSASTTTSPSKADSSTTGFGPAISTWTCDHTPPLVVSQQPTCAGGQTLARNNQYGPSAHSHASQAPASSAWKDSHGATSLPLRRKPTSAAVHEQDASEKVQIENFLQPQPKFAPLQRRQQPRRVPVPLPRRQQQPQRPPAPLPPTQQHRVNAHPRRVQTDPSWNKPRLVRQEDRKYQYVNALVGKPTPPAASALAFTDRLDVTESLLAHIWPAAASPLRVFDKDTGPKSIELHHFIEQLLKRTYASHSMLQLALYFCYMLGTSGALDRPTRHANQQGWISSHQALYCGRRMFLASLMLSFKTLNDKNMSSRAWRNLAGLSTKDINENEKAFLNAIDYRLFVREQTYQQWAKILDYQLACHRFGKALDWKRAFTMMTSARELGSPWLESDLLSSYHFNSLPLPSNLGSGGIELSSPPCRLSNGSVDKGGSDSSSDKAYQFIADSDHPSAPADSATPSVASGSASPPAIASEPHEDRAVPSIEDIAMCRPVPESPGSTGPVAPPAPHMGTISPPEVPAEESDGQGNWLLGIGTAGAQGLCHYGDVLPQTDSVQLGETPASNESWRAHTYEPAVFDVEPANFVGGFAAHQVCSQDNDSGYDSSSPMSTYRVPVGGLEDCPDQWQDMAIEEDSHVTTYNEELHEAVRQNLAAHPTPACSMDTEGDIDSLRPISDWLAFENNSQSSATDAAPAFHATQFDTSPFACSYDDSTASPSPKQQYTPATAHQPPSAVDTTFYEAHHERLEELEASAEQQLSDRSNKKRKAAQGSLRRKGSLRATAKRVKMEREKEKSRICRPAASANARVSSGLGVCSPPTSPVDKGVC